MNKENYSTLDHTKAEVLHNLSLLGFPIPKVYFFPVKEWRKSQDIILEDIIKNFSGTDRLAIRSSSQSEDTTESSMAGAFESFLNVPIGEPQSIKDKIDKVIASFDDNPLSQVLVQAMVENVAMSGVVMTKVLDDGSPYYVINFDDSTGRTDTVTSGTTINKTVYIYNGVKDEYFDSPYLLVVLDLVKNIESNFVDTPLDIEFAVDKNKDIFLLQVRPITTSHKWKKEINALVSSKIFFLEEYVNSLMSRRPNIYGAKTLLGIMPDWNPAEMIGVVPRPLSMSLYREIITKSAWRIAREKMGYHKLPNVELMVSLYGRTYIDIRNSINSFLPRNIEPMVAEKITNAYLKRLEERPHLHDKIEFDVVLTSYDFTFEKKFNDRYEGVLNRNEFLSYKKALFELTKKALEDSNENSLNLALLEIDVLKEKQKEKLDINLNDPFSISDHLNTLLRDCVQNGTIPFSVIARHGFMAETIMRSAVEVGIISEERINDFKRSVKTVASDMSTDFHSVCHNQMGEKEFLELYGHLRPSSYDIVSPCYRDREDLFTGSFEKNIEHIDFELTDQERKNINEMLLRHGFMEIDAVALFTHAEKAIIGREYAKFIFTKHLSDILELIAKWGDCIGISREKMSMLSLHEIQKVLLYPLTDDMKEFFDNRIAKAENAFALASSFKLSYLIRSIRDIYIAPMQRSAANYIGNKRIEKSIVVLGPYQKEVVDLEDKIVCIEGADPGYDWIFTRKIAGLITKYGGANSHMAIRCAEYNLPAAIGCGEQPFERVIKAKTVILDCEGKKLDPQLY